MRTLSNYQIMVYATSSIACLCTMIIIDYVLGSRAEHLNAWIILNKILGLETGIKDCLTTRHLGLVGATIFILIANTLFGIIIVQIFNLLNRIVNT